MKNALNGARELHTLDQQIIAEDEIYNARIAYTACTPGQDKPKEFTIISGEIESVNGKPTKISYSRFNENRISLDLDDVSGKSDEPAILAQIFKNIEESRNPATDFVEQTYLNKTPQQNIRPLI